MALPVREGNEPMHGVILRVSEDEKEAELVLMVEPEIFRDLLAGERNCISTSLDKHAQIVAELQGKGCDVSLHLHIVPDIIEWAKKNISSKDEVYETYEHLGTSPDTITKLQ